MSHILVYYDYSLCFAYYTERILSIRQAKIQGELIVAKPVLMLADMPTDIKLILKYSTP